MQEEKYGTRSLAYSAWHREKSTERFVGIERAHELSMIDADAVIFVEYDESNKEPVGLIEEAQDVGQPYKCATVTRNLARRADLPALLVLWTPSDTPNPAEPQWPDISEFRVKRLWPKPESQWRRLAPVEYARILVRLREWEMGHLLNGYRQDQTFGPG